MVDSSDKQQQQQQQQQRQPEMEDESLSEQEQQKQQQQQQQQQHQMETETPRFSSIPTMTAPSQTLISPCLTQKKSCSCPPSSSCCSSSALETKRRKFLSSQEKLLQQYYNQEQLLRETYQSACSNTSDQRRSNTTSTTSSSCCFALISGPNSRFVKRALSVTIQRDEGILIRGSFDPQRGSLVPYSAFVDALRQWVHANDQTNDEATTRTSTKTESLSNQFSFKDKQVLISVIPALESVLMSPPESYNNGGGGGGGGGDGDFDDQQQQQQDTAGFVLAFTRLLRILSEERPVVVVLENLQWADPNSIDLLLHLAQDEDLLQHKSQLLLVGTVNESLLSRDSYLACKLQQKHHRQNLITHIVLDKFTPAQVDQLLWETLRLELKGRQSLTQLFFQQTDGSLYNMIDFWQWLLCSDDADSNSSLLRQDRTSWSETWIYYDDSKLLAMLPKELGGFRRYRLTTCLSQSLQELLQVAACLGTTFDANDTLALVVGYDIEQSLEDLVRDGFLRRDGGVNNDRHLYAFEDGIQQAAYQCISEAHREEMHREIGRRIWESLDTHDQLDRRIFEILSHTYLGRALLKDENERIEVATLCVQAGAKTAKTSAFCTSAFYLKFGIDLLPERHWDKAHTYDLSHALYTAAAEVYTCGSMVDFQEVDRLLDIIVAKARTKDEKIHANSTRMYALSIQGKHSECIELGIQVLKQLGLTFPKSLAKIFLLPDMLTVGRLIRNKTNDQILCLPNMTNKKKLLTLQVLNHITLPCILNHPDLTPFVLIKQTVITLKYGLSVFAGTAFGTYGMFRIDAADDVPQAMRFQEMAKVLLERFGANEYLPRTYAAIYGCTNAFTRPPSECLEHLLHAYRVGKSLGDSEYSCLDANLYFLLTMEGGLPLSVLNKKYRPLFDEMACCPERKALVRVSAPTADFVDRLAGLSDPFSAKGNVIDMDLYYGEAVEAGSIQNKLEIHYCWMRLGYIFGDYQLAEQHCLNLCDVHDFAPSIQRIGVQFFIGLICIQAAQDQSGGGRKRQRNLRITRKICRKLSKWAKHAPWNVNDRKALLEAELAVAVRDYILAKEKYRLAIMYTEDSKSIMVRAIAQERCGRHLLAIGELAQAKACFEASCEAYRDWGAHGKQRRLEAEVLALPSIPGMVQKRDTCL